MFAFLPSIFDNLYDDMFYEWPAMPADESSRRRGGRRADARQQQQQQPAQQPSQQAQAQSGEKQQQQQLARPPTPRPAALWAWTPRCDVRETPKEVSLICELPGIRKEDITLQLEGGLLTVSGERREEKTNENERWHHVERSFGRFSRTMRVPDDIREDEIRANFDNGVLTVSFPNRRAQPRRIEITSAVQQSTTAATPAAAAAAPAPTPSSSGGKAEHKEVTRESTPAATPATESTADASSKAREAASAEAHEAAKVSASA